MCVYLCDNKAILPRWRAFSCNRVLPKGDAVRLLFGREKQKPFKLYSICIKCQKGDAFIVKTQQHVQDILEVYL
jgi:hypothetical protein